MNMETLELVLRVLLVLDALALIGLVLLQQGRGASMGAAFGSGASATMETDSLVMAPPQTKTHQRRSVFDSSKIVIM